MFYDKWNVKRKYYQKRNAVANDTQSATTRLAPAAVPPSPRKAQKKSPWNKSRCSYLLFVFSFPADHSQPKQLVHHSNVNLCCNGVVSLQWKSACLCVEICVSGEVPPRFVNSTPWGRIRNVELLRMLDRRLEERDTWQGRYCK